MNRGEAIARATAAIKRACREEEPGSDGLKIIGDLATWEIEERIVAAVTEELRKPVLNAAQRLRTRLKTETE